MAARKPKPRGAPKAAPRKQKAAPKSQAALALVAKEGTLGESVRMSQLSDLWLVGNGAPPGEVIFDIVRQGETGHQRFSTWSDNGSFDLRLPGSIGPGSWVISAESAGNGSSEPIGEPIGLEVKE